MSRFLLDTHAWIWIDQEPERIPRAAQSRLDRGEWFLSVASVHEIAIKYRLGKLPLPEPPAIFIPKRLAEEDTHALDISIAHALAAGELPMHHPDPFDRLIIAQAIAEGMTLVTADQKLRAYPARLLWVGE